MDARLVIPVRIRPDMPLRRRNLWVCLEQLARSQAWLRARRRDAEIVLAEHDNECRVALEVEHFGVGHVRVPGDGPFAKARCCNAGVGRRGPPLVCIFDADCWIGVEWLERCLALIDGWKREKVWRGAMLPYRRFRFLEQAPSALVAAGELPTVDLRHEACPSVGGSVWVERRLYRRIGGWDEGYEGWGPDDRDFVYRLTVAAGAPLLRGDLPLWHLFHEEQNKSTDPEGWKRLRATQKRLGPAPAGG